MDIARPSRWGGLLLFGVAFALIASVGAVGLGVSLPNAWIWALASALFLLLVAGVVWQGSGIFARPMLAVRTVRPELALTFDDGPDPRFTPALMDLLESRGHRATFFVIGERAEAYPELLAELARRGHGLANHSYRHAYGTNFVSPRRLANELLKTSELIGRAAGSPPRWFRSPMGLLSPRVAAAARMAHLDWVGWTASGRDGVGWRRVEDAVQRLRRHLSPGSILVLHDGLMGRRSRSIAQEVLIQLLDLMDAKGLRSVTLDQLVEGDEEPTRGSA